MISDQKNKLDGETIIRTNSEQKHSIDYDQHARSNTFTTFKIGFQASLILFYAERTTMLDVPKCGEFEKEYFNTIGGVSGINRGTPYFDAKNRQIKNNLQEFYKDCTIIVQYFVFLLHIPSIMKVFDALKH